MRSEVASSKLGEVPFGRVFWRRSRKTPCPQDTIFIFIEGGFRIRPYR